MGQMQAIKRMSLERDGLARGKRHGIGKMTPELYDLCQIAIRETYQRAAAEIHATWEDRILNGDGTGSNMTGLLSMHGVR